jgi:hypothetical protein
VITLGLHAAEAMDMDLVTQVEMRLYGLERMARPVMARFA